MAARPGLRPDTTAGPRWGGLSWSPWVPFDGADFVEIPTGPGLYRVRSVGRRGLVYIGETGRSLRGRLLDLCRMALGTRMPFSDPHTAGPGLWAYRRDGGLRYECSAAESALPVRRRRGLEAYLLWRYRLAHGASPLCSLGRFHPKYSKSALGSSGVRGKRMRGARRNPAGQTCAPALRPQGSPTHARWMGLAWVDASGIDCPKSGLYRIFARRAGRLLYVGQSKNLQRRCRGHRGRDWGAGRIFIEVASRPARWPTHRLQEQENDLIGAYYWRHGDVPTRQSWGTPGTRVDAAGS
jgi:hypothetical protein